MLKKLSHLCFLNFALFRPNTLQSKNPLRCFARKIPETIQQVIDYKNPKKVFDPSLRFEDEDRRSYVKRLRFQFSESKLYHKIQNKWKNNLIRKQKRKERRVASAIPKSEIATGPTKLVMHSPVTSELNVNESLTRNSFAVISINGRQHKVTTDDVILINALTNFNVGDIIESHNVLLVGNKYFTLIGRPLVEQARVFMSVEAQTKGRKVIVFKKKRRKGYRRNYGHRQLQTFLRVHKIEYEVDQSLAQRAVGIWSDPQV